MRAFRFFLTGAVLGGLSACYSVPSEPDFTMRLSGDYKSVADCAWLKFRTLGNWHRTDLDSMQTVEFAFGNDVSTAGRIDVTLDVPNRTRVESHMPGAIWGKDYWSKQFRPIFASCGG